jgi:hypothetical protein
MRQADDREEDEPGDDHQQVRGKDGAHPRSEADAAAATCS